MRAKPFHCAECRNRRLHEIERRDLADGRLVRFRVCTACATDTLLTLADVAGMCCPKCSDIRLGVWSTRENIRGVMRIRVCRHCDNKMRTCESVERVTV